MSIMVKESEAHKRFEHFRPTLGQAPTTTDTPESKSFEEFRRRKRESGIDKSADLFK